MKIEITSSQILVNDRAVQNAVIDRSYTGHPKKMYVIHQEQVYELGEVIREDTKNNRSFVQLFPLKEPIVCDLVTNAEVNLDLGFIFGPY